MGELINNSEQRQQVLKEIIKKLHGGSSVEEVKEEFANLIEGVSAMEISRMEANLIMEGMAVEEIQRLCDVHAEVFKGSIEDIHREVNPTEEEGHPLNTFKLENDAIRDILDREAAPAIEGYRESEDDGELLLSIFEKLYLIDTHYKRKENLIFPYMEKNGITAPPKVMWGVDDEIRDQIKEVISLLKEKGEDRDLIALKASDAANRVEEMIFKEENIMFPMIIEAFSEDEWIKIAAESDEFGYCFIEKPKGYRELGVKTEPHGPARQGEIEFDAGSMDPQEINALLNTLPFDMTFVDKTGRVKYFTQGKERIFPRPKTVLGREVSNCHPPSSVHIVEKIIEDLISGKKDHEDFWIKMGDKYVYIRYFAVRGAKGEYLGVVEVTQDIKPIQEITGEKRLMNP